jgi:DNA mismatch repair protein MutS
LDDAARLQPAEILVNDGYENAGPLETVTRRKPRVYPAQKFAVSAAFHVLTAHFRTLDLLGFGLVENSREVNAAGALLTYLSETQKNNLSHITSLRVYSGGQYMSLDASSRRNLELTQNLRDKKKQHTLLGVLDKTKTAAGSRLLRRWLEQPLLRPGDIQKRLDAVAELAQEALLREELRENFSLVQDLERLMAKIIYKSGGSRELAALRNSIKPLPLIKETLAGCRAPLLAEIHSHFDTLTDIYDWIDCAIGEDPPFGVRDGGFIKDGYNAELDQLRDARSNGADWLAEMEAAERKKTGIKTLKIKYSKVFGYCIEVTNSYKEQTPAHYIRRQTLSNCERYSTEELKKIEDAILGADEKIAALEYCLFVELRDKVASQVERIQLSAAMVATVDTIQSLANAADKYHYCQPEVDDSGIIEIKNGRHPVVEQMMNQPFVPNDVRLDQEADRLAIITGPNMAGKSTYMRQTALIALMAQAGSFVPADSARIGVVDRIFTRVGAADDLAAGQSTFMQEMSEVANIVNNATKNSLLILDEIGRGTSTVDGLSIAWAVVEYIADENQIGAKTLFATHYHELTELEGKVDGVKNYCVTVHEQGEDVIFLRKIVRGGADHSYGIQVARLAGLPSTILERSREILAALNSAAVVRIEAEARAVLREESLRRKRRKPDKEQEDDQMRLMDWNDWVAYER